MAVATEDGASLTNDPTVAEGNSLDLDGHDRALEQPPPIQAIPRMFRGRLVAVGAGRTWPDTTEPCRGGQAGALSWADSASGLMVAGVGFEPT